MGMFILLIIVIIPYIMSHYFDESYSTEDGCSKHNPNHPKYNPKNE